MRRKELFGLALGALVLGLAVMPAFAQGNRGKTEMKAGSGSITVDYGRPALKGRDMLSQLAVGSFWRMGANQATVFTTPVGLTFGTVKVAAGSYSLWLKRTAEDKYELWFNSQTGQWGTSHDQSKDVAGVPMKMTALSSPVEVFTIELKSSGNGGTFVLQWGKSELTSDFTLE
jgi:hypothetical protein